MAFSRHPFTEDQRIIFQIKKSHDPPGGPLLGETPGPYCSKSLKLTASQAAVAAGIVVTWRYLEGTVCESFSGSNGCVVPTIRDGTSRPERHVHGYGYGVQHRADEFDNLLRLLAAPYS